LLVLRCSDLARSKAFYEALGLEFWAVWRQNDNGNRFSISSGHPRAAAERLRADLGQLGHKQMYWTSAEDA
jgi:catechol 2,3-dioxygenase-like lactoylglutathione lyase family enzyme